MGKSRLINLAVLNQTVLLEQSPGVCDIVCGLCTTQGSAGQVLRIERDGQDFPCTQPFQQLADIERLTSTLKLHCLPGSVLFLPEAAPLSSARWRKGHFVLSTCLSWDKRFSAFARLYGWLWQRSLWAILVVLQLQCHWNSNFFPFYQVLQQFVTKWRMRHFLWVSWFG